MEKVPGTQQSLKAVLLPLPCFLLPRQTPSLTTHVFIPPGCAAFLKQEKMLVPAFLWIKNISLVSLSHSLCCSLLDPNNTTYKVSITLLILQMEIFKLREKTRFPKSWKFSPSPAFHSRALSIRPRILYVSSISGLPCWVSRFHLDSQT